MEILEEWIAGRGKQPVIWKTLIEVLHDIELSTLAREIEAVKLQSTVSDICTRATEDSDQREMPVADIQDFRNANSNNTEDLLITCFQATLQECENPEEVVKITEEHATRYSEECEYSDAESVDSELAQDSDEAIGGGSAMMELIERYQNQQVLELIERHYSEHKREDSAGSDSEGENAIAKNKFIEEDYLD